MRTDPAKLEAAYTHLTAQVRKEAARAFRTGRGPGRPPAHMMYRWAGGSVDESTGIALSRIASRLAAQIEREGYRLRFASPGGRSYGVTNHAEREVRIDPELREDQAVRTMIHELAHIRLRHFKRQFAFGGDPRELFETEAEGVAYVVSASLGMDVMGFCAPYIANWSGGDMDLVTMSARNVVKVAQLILEDL